MVLCQYYLLKFEISKQVSICILKTGHDRRIMLPLLLFAHQMASVNPINPMNNNQGYGNVHSQAIVPQGPHAISMNHNNKNTGNTGAQPNIYKITTNIPPTANNANPIPSGAPTGNSDIKNKLFNDIVRSDLQTFKEFLNRVPGAKNQYNTVLSNYGIIDPDTVSDENGLALPNPKYLLKSVEESLAIHASFKMFLRHLLENVQQYMVRSSMLLAETVLRLKNKYTLIVNTFNSLNSTKNTDLRAQLAKELLDARAKINLLAQRFKDLESWRREILNGIVSDL